MNARTRWLTFLPWFLALLAPLAAQGDEGELTVRAELVPATAKPGDEVVLVLHADVTAGWHAYGTRETINLPTSLSPAKVDLGGLEAVGEPQVPEGSPHSSPLGTQYPLPKQFEVRWQLKVPAGQKAGELTVDGALTYQICDANSCLPPTDADFSVKLKVEAGAGGAAAEVGKPVAGHGLKPGLQLVPDPVKFKVVARFEPASVKPGATATLVLQATVDEKYHAYGTKEEINLPVSLDLKKVARGALEPVGEPMVPPGEPQQGPFGLQHPLPHEFEVKQEFRVPATLAAGEVVVKGGLTYQICDATMCEPPEDAPFAAKLVVEAGAAVVTPPVKEPVKQPTKEPVQDAPTIDNPFANSWWALILACIGGGLFALAMPCTYPMVPITFSFFTKQAEKRHGNVLSLAVVYGLGIVVMFVLVGVLLSSVILQVANHWVTNSIIGIVFLLFAFNLFGWITIEPPRKLQDLAAKASGVGGLAGVFFMGAALVITSFTCTAPIVGTLLPQIAELGVLRVALGMAVFGLTMAAPFVVLAMMPTKVKALPRSGEWMETLKVSLGFVELAATLKFVSMVDIALDWNALPRELFLLLIAVIFVMWAMYLFGILRKAGTVNEGVGSGRMATGMAVVLFATYLLFGAMGYKLDYYMTAFAPPYSAPLVAARAEAKATGAGEQKPRHGHTIVDDDGDRAIEVAKAEDKLLLYNFTGFN
ncbi:MAG: hypothetical protein K8J09_22335 [Planctomycetes bacterium]|nr:hypothetical protein [Planctomycetota bacterium]MCC7395818.1 hypothetical protein [Planctomycetota bacterium]